MAGHAYRLFMQGMRAALGLLLCLLSAASVPACSLIHSPSGRIEPLTAASADELGCTPLMLAVFGRDEVGGGSGVAVHERIILTAGHVVPSDARFLVAATNPGERPQGTRIRRVIRGDGEATTQGDWALLILDRPLSRIGCRPAAQMCGQERCASPGQPVVIAGFPFLSGHDPEDLRARESILLRTTLDSPPPGDPSGGSSDFLFASYVPGRTDLSGLSGAPVFLMPAGAQPLLVGIHIATGVSKFAGTIMLDRAAVIRRLPLDAINKAIAELPPLPPRP